MNELSTDLWTRRIVALATLCLLSAAMPLAGGADVSDLRLVEAVRNRNWQAVPALLKQVNVNASQPDGATALHWAAQWDDLRTVDLLIRGGANVNAANDYGVTPLSLAATNGAAPTIEALLKAGANPNTALPTGETALMTAARTGRLAAVQALLARGADVNARENVMGQTALMWALSERHLDVAETLVGRGADVRARSTSGFTAMLFATRQGDIDAVRMLMAHGATASDTATDGTSALLMATVRGHIELAEFLLNQGADPNADGTGYTPLHWAAGTWESATTRDYRVREWIRLAGPTGEEKKRLIAALLAHGARPNARARRAPPRFGSSAWGIRGGGTPAGATPFFFAAISGDVDVMRLLLANGADPLTATNDNTTPLIGAAGLGVEESETLVPESRHLDAVRLLLDLGADIRAANNQGDTVLHAAAFQGYDTVARLLVDRGAALNPKNRIGQTPYKIASGITVTQMFFRHPSTEALLQKLGGVE